MINLFIIDDHELVRMGLSRLLSEVQGFKVIAEASSGEEALELLSTLKPDVIIMDVKMPGIGGLEATNKILSRSPKVKIIIISSCSEEPFPSRLLDAGASGYLTKAVALEEVVEAIRTVYAGRRYICAEIAHRKALKNSNDKKDTPFIELSERELQVMLMITSGHNAHSIADKLFLSPKTVNSYRYRLFDKLQVSSDVELTLLAIRYGLVDLGANE